MFRASFWLSIQISLETVAVSLVLMVPTVFWVHLRLPGLRPVMDLISILPLWCRRSCSLSGSCPS